MATLLYGPVRTAEAGVAVGGSSADFLQFEVGGRSAGMAGAFTGPATGITAQFWNPAALARLDQPQVGAMHATWLQDLNYEWLGYARPMGPRLGVGSLSLAYFHLPSIQAVDAYDNPAGQFRVYDLAVTAGLARPLSRNLAVGMNAKMIRQNLATVSATGAAVDLGIQAAMHGTSFGAVVQNLGPDLSFNGSAYPLPQQIRLGVSRGFWRDRLLVATDYNIPRDYYKDVRVGTEFQAHPNVSLRLGYRKELGSSGDPATGISFGVGFHFHQLQLDYAMTPSNVFDDVHRLSFGYSFGSGSEEAKPETPQPETKPLPPPPPAPTGPPVIAQGKGAPAKATPKPTDTTTLAKAGDSKASAQAPKTSETTAPKAAPKSETPEPAVAQAPAPPPTPAPTKEKKAATTEYLVVLPGYASKESATAEIKALELLGFRTKDAKVDRDDNGGYIVRLATTRSKSSADDMAASLGRMSFRAVVQMVQR
ncbi:MAG: PorV/PorQ family protein [Hyphomicrobiales bacterium]